MGTSRTKWLRLVVREFAAAFGVLSLILLSVAHQPIDTGGRDFYRLADGSVPVICGTHVVPKGEAALTSGCDACRISAGVVMPDAPCRVIDKIAFIDLFDGLPKEYVSYLHFVEQAQLPRAPPIFV